jgi:hypothetical protein
MHAATFTCPTRHPVPSLPPMLGVLHYYGLRFMPSELFNIVLRERVFSLPYDSKVGEISRASGCSLITHTFFSNV